MTLELSFRSLEETAPGDAWRRVFAHGWPGWRHWYLRASNGTPPELMRSRLALRRHMPELEPVWARLVEVAEADESGATFLTFWNPPRYLAHCSQAVFFDHEGPLLIRNYDLDPSLNESTVFKTQWLTHRVMGMVEGMAGLADGMNDAGLAVSLTFGGRIEHGSGFGIPMIIRYLLEVCTDVREALDALRRIPSHMSYNLTLLDRSGNWATVLLAPDRPPLVLRKPYATNHQLGVEWPHHGRETLTLERYEHLVAMSAGATLNEAQIVHAFLTPPLYSDRYHKGFGTVYTVVYRPTSGRMTLCWPEGEHQSWSFDRFPAAQFGVRYGSGGSALAGVNRARLVPVGQDGRLQ